MTTRDSIPRDYAIKRASYYFPFFSKLYSNLPFSALRTKIATSEQEDPIINPYILIYNSSGASKKVIILFWVLKVSLFKYSIPF